MLLALLDRLLGRRRSATSAPWASADAFVPRNRDAPPRAEAAPAVSLDGVATFLCRETLLGRNQRIAGYRFMVQEGTRTRLRHPSRRVHHVQAEVLVRSLANADIGDLLSHRVAFIDIPDSFLSDPCLAQLPAGNVVLVPTAHADPGAPDFDSLRATVEALRGRGFRLGVHDPNEVTEFAPLLPFADFIIAQAQGMDARRGLQLSNIALEVAANARLLVRGLLSIEDFRFSDKLGAKLFQGPFITRREDWHEREPGPDMVRIGALIARLRADADSRALAELLKQDPALSLRLLRYINAVTPALPQRVSSIERALTGLGRDQLYRSLILLACSADTRNERGGAALETALVRGRMMELLGEGRPPGERDALFLVGLLSLIDVILQVPLDKALAPLAVSPDIDAALRNGDGPLRPLLELAIACECADGEAIGRAAEGAGVEPGQASACHLQALAWALQLQD